MVVKFKYSYSMTFRTFGASHLIQLQSLLKQINMHVSVKTDWSARTVGSARTVMSARTVASARTVRMVGTARTVGAARTVGTSRPVGTNSVDNEHRQSVTRMIAAVSP